MPNYHPRIAVKKNDIYIVNPTLKTATSAAVEAAERKLKAKFPTGYAEFVTQFGEGLYCTYMRVYPPGRIVKENPEFQQRIREYYFWDKGAKVLAKERALESIRIADTLDGDELIFHPTRPDELFVLPRHADKVFAAGRTFDEALEWLCRFGKVGKDRYFDSSVGCKSIEIAMGEKRPPLKKLRDTLLALKLHAKVAQASDLLQIFMPDLAGEVAIGGPAGEYAVSINTGRSAKRDAVKRVIDALAGMGMYEQGKEPPVLVDKLTAKYFPLAKILADAPTEKTAPDQVVRQFIRAMNVLETGMRKFHNGGHADPTMMATIFKRISEAFCHRVKFAGTYSTPPQFDPDRTTVPKAKITGDTATIVAKLRGLMDKTHTYTLEKVRGVWGVTRVDPANEFGRGQRLV
jgi:hypothetical protein